jgi:hypothetical protein
MASEGEAGSFPESEDQAYFRAVEEQFVALRGAPMLLTPADWQVARSWRRRGIPLGLVREALETVFEKRRERGAASRVNSLRYCASAVEKAWRAQVELGLPAASGGAAGGGTAAAVPELLALLAAGLPEGLPGVEGWRMRIRAVQGDIDEVERQLVTLEAELLLALEEALPEGERAAHRRATREAVARLSQRVGGREVEQAAERLAALRLRERWGVTALSLFAAGVPARAASRAAADEDAGPAAARFDAVRGGRGDETEGPEVDPRRRTDGCG